MIHALNRRRISPIPYVYVYMCVGMSHFAVLDLCARLEDLIYNETMKQFHVSSTATGVWSKREAIDSFVLKW